MTSDGNKPEDQGEDIDLSAEEVIDVTDDVDMDAELSAGPGDDAAYEDADFDDDDLDLDEEPAFKSFNKKRSISGGGMGKLIVPILVLGLAAGAGGYIVVNPQILGGGAEQPPAPAVVNFQDPSMDQQQANAMMPPPAQQIPEPSATDFEMPLFDEGAPPQPVMSQNEQMPEAPVPTMSADDLEDKWQVAQGDAAYDSGEDDPFSVDQSVMDGADVAMPPSDPDYQYEYDDPMSQDTDAQNAQLEETVFPGVQEVDEPMPDIGAAISETMDAEQESHSDFMPQDDYADTMFPETDTGMPEATLTPMGDPQASMSAPQSETQGVSAGVPMTPQEAANTGPDIYYDATIDLPSGPMGKIGPRKINPELEPASRYVVVTKTHEKNDFESQVVSANRALKLDRYDAALEMFDQLYAKNPRDQRVLMGRAVAQQQTGLTDSAINTYEELLDINPNNTEAMVNMMGLVRKQYPEIALRRLLDLYSKHSNNAGIAAQIGITQAGLGKAQDALKYLGMAATLEPQNAQHLYNMAIIADREGIAKQAIGYYEQALQVDAVYGKGRTLPRDTIYDRLAVLRQRL